MTTKIEIFMYTFLCYTSVHALRTAYSSSKSSIQKHIQTQNKYMGILDSLMLLFLGLGHFMHAIRPIKKPVRSLWIAMIASSINFMMMPLFLNFEIFSNLAYLAIFQILNGFLQSYTWPNLLMIINEKYSQKKNPVLLGFWSTNANFGNILGYLVFQFIKLDWKYDLIVAGFFALVNGCIIGFKVKQLNNDQIEPRTSIRALPSSQLTNEQDFSNQATISTQQLNKNLLSANEIKEQQLDRQQNARNHLTNSSTQSQILTQSVNEPAMAAGIGSEPRARKSLLSLLKDPKIMLITITFSLIKSVIYGIMLWLPLYFKTKEGFSQYAQSIPITYDIAAIFGSIFIGYLFMKIINKGLLMIPFVLALVFAFFLLRFFQFGVTFVFFMIAIIGFCLGGIFNTLAGLVVMELTSSLPAAQKSQNLGIYSAITMAAGNITTALTQILIGFVIGKQHQQSVFLVFMIYSAICLISLILMSIITELKSSKGKEDDKKEQHQQNKVCQDYHDPCQNSNSKLRSCGDNQIDNKIGLLTKIWNADISIREIQVKQDRDNEQEGENYPTNPNEQGYKSAYLGYAQK